MTGGGRAEIRAVAPVGRRDARGEACVRRRGVDAGRARGRRRGEPEGEEEAPREEGHRRHFGAIAMAAKSL